MAKKSVHILFVLIFWTKKVFVASTLRRHAFEMNAGVRKRKRKRIPSRRWKALLKYS